MGSANNVVTSWMKTVRQSGAKFNGNYQRLCDIVSLSKPNILWNGEFDYNDSPKVEYSEWGRWFWKKMRHNFIRLKLYM